VDSLVANFVKADKKDIFKTELDNLEVFTNKFNDNSKVILETYGLDY